MSLSYDSIKPPSPLHSFVITDDDLILIKDEEESQVVYDSELKDIFETELDSLVDVSWVKNKQKVIHSFNEINMPVENKDSNFDEDLVKLYDLKNDFELSKFEINDDHHEHEDYILTHYYGSGIISDERNIALSDIPNDISLDFDESLKIGQVKENFASKSDFKDNDTQCDKIIMELKDRTDLIIMSDITPTAFSGSNQYQSLTVTLQLLCSCREFREQIIEYHNSDSIATFGDYNTSTEMMKKLLFVNELCKLFHDINSQKTLTGTSKKFDNFINGFDSVEKTYELVLQTITTIMQSDGRIDSDSMEQSSRLLHTINNLFNGKLQSKTWCLNCTKSYDEKLEEIRVIPLKFTRNLGIISVKQCVEDFFDIHDCNDQLKKSKCCDCPNIVSQYRLKDSSKYLLLYFKVPLELTNNEGSVPIELCEQLHVPAESGDVTYGLRGVVTTVNHSFSIECLYDDWWQIGEDSTRKIPMFNFVKDSIDAILIKRL